MVYCNLHKNGRIRDIIIRGFLFLELYNQWIEQQVIHHLYPYKSSYEYPAIANKMKHDTNYNIIRRHIVQQATYMYKMGKTM